MSLRGADGKTASERASGSSGLGLTTGKTWHGNTAYGPAGGNASGFATSKTDSKGKTSYSNYKTPSGQNANVSWAGKGGAHNTISSKAVKTSTPYKSPNEDTSVVVEPLAKTYKKLAETSPQVAAALDRSFFGRTIAGVRGGNPMGVQAYNGGPASKKGFSKDQSRVKDQSRLSGGTGSKKNQSRASDSPMRGWGGPR